VRGAPGGCGAQGSRAQGVGSGVKLADSGFRVQGSGFRVQGWVSVSTGV
jgi:hypothetical protein